MILTDFYKMERLPEFDKNKIPRFDCISSTGEYPYFEQIAYKSRVKRFFFHFVDTPERFDANVRRKTDKAMTNGNSITSVFMWDIDSHFAFGDCRGTQDAMLMIFSPDYTKCEIYIARGEKNNRGGLCNLLADGELDNEINELKKRVKGNSVTDSVTK